MRLKMAALAGAAVVVTLFALAVPTYRGLRTALARAQGERLMAIARSAESTLPAEFSSGLGSSGTAPLPSPIRDLVRRIRVSTAQSLGEGSELLSLDILVRSPDGRFRYLLHGDQAAVGEEYLMPRDGVDVALGEGRSASTSIFDLDGESVMSGAVPITGENRAVVGAVIATGRADALLADARRAVRSLALWAALAFLVAITLAYFAATRLTYGMLELSQQATRVARGQLRQELVFESDDEVGELANTFRDMTAGLRTLVTQIESSACEVASTAEELASSA